MLKVLLVDDEELSLEMLKNLIDWSRYGIEIAGCAGNGNEALEIFMQEKPEIIITDIRMPGMDGMEMVRRCKEYNSNLEFIFVSAYADFEYAQQALAMEGANYLIKPVDEYELEKTIKKIVDKIDRMKTEKRLVEKAENEKCRMDIWYYLTSGNGRSIAQKAHSKLRMDLSTFSLMGFTLSESSMDTHIRNSVQIDAKLSFIQKKLSERLSRWCDSLLFSWRDQMWTALLYNVRVNLRECAEDILDFLSREMNIEAHACYTRIESGIENLPDAMKRLELLVEYTAFVGDENIVGDESETEDNSKDLEILSNAGKSLVSAINRNDLSLASSIVNETLSSVTQTTPDIMPYIRDFAYMGIQSMRNNSNGKELTSITYSNIEALNTREELMAFMLEKLSIMEGREEKEKPLSTLVENGMKYLESNFDRNISLEEICDELGVSRNYFSYLFKKETGQNIWAYLTSIRIMKAKQLLTLTDEKTYVIAYQVGYDNPSYFAKLFKKATGLTPNEYRTGSRQEN